MQSLLGRSARAVPERVHMRQWERDEPQPKPHQYLTGLRTMRQEYERAVQAQEPILQRALLVRDVTGRERWFSFQDATHPSWWPEGYSPYTQ